jgi:hypothetical protein
MIKAIVGLLVFSAVMYVAVTACGFGGLFDDDDPERHRG